MLETNTLNTTAFLASFMSGHLFVLPWFVLLPGAQAGAQALMKCQIINDLSICWPLCCALFSPRAHLE